LYKIKDVAYLFLKALSVYFNNIINDIYIMIYFYFNFGMDLRDIGWGGGWSGFTWLRIGTVGGLL
jgi:hypothetical protein